MKISQGLIVGWLTLALATPALAADEAQPDKSAKAADKKSDASPDASVEESADGESDESKEEEEEETKPWSVGVRLGSSIGQGTFVNVSNDSEYADPNCVDPIVQGCVGDASNAFDRANLSYGINGSYTFKKFSFSTGLTLVQWLTPGGGLNAPNEVRLRDSGLGIGYEGWEIESIGVSFSPSLGLQFPTSKFARVATLILGTSLGLSISKTLFDRLGLSLNLGLSKDFHSSESPLIDQERLDKKLTQEEQANLGDEVRPEAVVFRAEEEVKPGLVAVGGVNTEWGVSTGVSASWAVWDKLRLSASYTISTSWTYAIDDNPDVEPQGDFIQGNRGVGQSFGTSIGLSYPYKIKDVRLGFSAGIGTGGYPKTSDNKSFRFPFWNTSGAAANASSVRLGISATY